MATAMRRFPFTSAQWLELERQALIYKHIIACAPIPTNLLLPIFENHSEISNTTTTSHSALGRFNLRSSHNTDPEPGRCKRTDGKKWRCSRDVAPDQKYCERHMNRGRPRSRKHVEVQTREINNINLPSSSMSPSPMAKPYSLRNGFSLASDFNLPPENVTLSASPYKDIRSMDWMLKRETVPMALSPNQQWEQLMHPKTGLRSFSDSPVFERQQQQYQGTLSLNSYTDFNGTDTSETQQQNQNDQFSLFLNPELTLLSENLPSDQQQTPRSFIDAWSTTAKPIATQSSKSSSLSSSSFKFPPYNLSLSMSGCNSTTEDEDIDHQIEMGLASKSPTLSWMSSPVSWMASQPGGPLGEALQSSTAAITSKSSSSIINGGFGLNLTTDGWISINNNNAENFGVLQKTQASFSDGSGSSSPNSQIALQLLNHTKF